MKKLVNICTDLITAEVALQLIPAFTAAYGMAISAIDSVDFLGGIFRKQNLPHLTNWAVEYELQRRANEGIIPFSCSIVSNRSGNHVHTELHKDGFLLTASQTHRIYEIPRDCVFRNEHSWDGQIAMEGFEDDDPCSDKEIYAVLTHGWGNGGLAYVFCGIPSPQMSEWVQGVNLFDVAKGMSVIDETPVDEDIKLDFREKVKKIIAEESV